MLNVDNCSRFVHGEGQQQGNTCITLLLPCAGGAPGSAPQQWRALAQQRALLIIAPDDEVLGELLVLQVRHMAASRPMRAVALRFSACLRGLSVRGVCAEPDNTLF